MNSVLISVSEVTAARLLNKAQQEQISVAGLLEKLSLSLTLDDQDISDPGCVSQSERTTGRGSVSSSPWLDVFIDRVKKLPSGTSFSVASVLAEEWDQLPDRRALGRMISRRLRLEKLATRHGDYDAPGLPSMANYIRN
ncbi:hypothetical protein [Stutzerimonas nitrititolerans]|uniref:hypothetical protein n=1 Tax=Stutzerimonas nitrititolerans TaxID=2482751 RepID=UPI0028A7362E|nr:hypothetical protein [Stutzerimonas nitrititolerans]